MALEIAVPIGLLSLASKHMACLRLRIIVHYFDHHLPDDACFATDVGNHHDMVPQQPAQMPAVQVTRQTVCPFAQASGLWWGINVLVIVFIFSYNYLFA